MGINKYTNKNWTPTFLSFQQGIEQSNLKKKLETGLYKENI